MWRKESNQEARNAGNEHQTAHSAVATARTHAQAQLMHRKRLMMRHTEIDSANRLFYNGPLPWEHRFGFHRAGMVGDDFFKPYAVTFDFQNMQIFLQ
jgi:hypothetical protein